MIAFVAEVINPRNPAFVGEFFENARISREGRVRNRASLFPSEQAAAGTSA